MVTSLPLDEIDEFLDVVHNRDKLYSTLNLIEMSHDRIVANEWLWSCTPYPCGQPSEECLQEGRDVAYGRLSIWELIGRVERQLEEDMKNYALRNHHQKQKP